MKSEPDAYSIEDLRRDTTTPWDGIRNYQARNFMRDDMTCGDLVLFYHSNTKPPGVVGIGEVASEPYPDPTAFDPESKYFDPKSKEENPRWLLVDIRYVDTLPEFVDLEALKNEASLDGMLVAKKGQRLSIQPVSAKHFRHVLKMGKRDMSGDD